MESGFGFYQINDVKMNIEDHVVKWDEEKNSLEVILTPSKLSSEEKTAMVDDPVRFSLPGFKESPNTEVWKNYPYVQLSISFKSEEVNLENLRAVSVNTFGVEGEGGNTFFSIFKSDLNLTDLNFKDGKLEMKFSGNKKGYPDGEYSWQIDLK